MKKLIFTYSLLYLFTSFNSFGQNIKLEKSDGIIVQPPPSGIINNPSPSDTSSFEGDRLVFWVHGLGGTDFSWDAASAPIANNYKVTSLLNGVDYSSYSLENAGQVLQTTIDGLAQTYGELNGIEDPANTNYIIAHSQGGLVSRSAYKRYADLNAFDQRSFGGVVTFGTPHQGAQIINNLEDILSFADNSCVALAAGPAVEAWNGTWIINLFNEEVMESAVNAICGMMANQVLPLVMQDYTESITEDYYVGASSVNALNEFDADMEDDPSISMQKVAFFGVEEAPVVWRTAYSLTNDVNAEGAYGANDDDGLLSKVASNQSGYYSKYMAYKTLHEITTAFCPSVVGLAAILNPLLCLPEALNSNYNPYGDFIDDNVTWFTYLPSQAGENRDAYYQGWQWWLNVEDTYLSLIGAVEYQQSGCHCDCDEKYGSDPTPVQVLYNVDCSVGNCQAILDNEPEGVNILGCEFAVVYDLVVKPNDGVVLMESAQNYPGAENGSQNVMIGSNHFQMRNDSNTEEKLMELVIGDHGPFFYTVER